MKRWRSPWQLVFLLLSLSGTAQAKAEPLPIDHFTRHGDFLSLSLSPDGQHMVARVQQQGTVAALVIRRADKAQVGGFKTARGNWMPEVNWASNDRLVYSVGMKDGAFDSPVATGELYSVNLDGSDNRLIFGFRKENAQGRFRNGMDESAKASHRILETLPEDPDHILLQEEPWERVGAYYYNRGNQKPFIGRLNVYNGKWKDREQLPHPGAQALATVDGSVNLMSWATQNRGLRTAIRSGRDAPWLELDFSQRGLFHPWLVSATRDYRQVFLGANTGPERVRQLFVLDTQEVTLQPWFDDQPYDVDSVIMEHSGQQPAVAISWPGKPSYRYAGAALPRERHHQQLVKAFPNQHVDITSSDSAGRFLLAHVSGPMNPGEYYLFDTQQNKVDFVLANASWLDPRSLRPTEPVAMTTPDGLKLHGYLTLPLTSKGTPAALVVLPHGGPRGVRDYWAFNPEVQLLANRGYAVLQVNFRSSYGYGDAFARAGDRQWGGRVIDDIIGMTRHVIKQPDVDGKRVCIFGSSFGGYAALMTAARAPDLVRCAVGYAGIYDLTRLADEGDVTRFIGGRNYLAEVLGDDSEELARYSPTTRAQDIKAPVLLIHGAKDLRAPMAGAKRMRRALKDAGNNAEWLAFPRAGHGVRDEQDRKRLYERLLQFLEKHI